LLTRNGPAVLARFTADELRGHGWLTAVPCRGDAEAVRVGIAGLDGPGDADGPERQPDVTAMTVSTSAARAAKLAALRGITVARRHPWTFMQPPATAGARRTTGPPRYCIR
jgi:hypothetical protein